MDSTRIILLTWSYIFYYTRATVALGPPDYESGWNNMGKDFGRNVLTLEHNLGEMPLLVDVQVKSMDSPNLDFIFPGVGNCIRDDDKQEQYADLCYIYNEQEIIMSMPERNNHYATGRAIYVANDAYIAGPNSQMSERAMVRVRIWLQSSLPPPDFFTVGLPVKTPSSNLAEGYKDIDHTLSEYPSIVIVRVKLLDGTRAGYMANGIGSLPGVSGGGKQIHSGSMYGFNDQTIRVWIASDSESDLWYGKDGHLLDGKAYVGELEIYAWRSLTFPPAMINQGSVGESVSNEDFQLPFQYPGIQNFYLQVWAEAMDGANIGYRFPGSGAVSYFADSYDSVCSYGGLTYAYNADEIRLWRPTATSQGGIICIGSMSGLGTNSQLSTSAKIVANTWILNMSSLWTTEQYDESSWNSCSRQ